MKPGSALLFGLALGAFLPGVAAGATLLTAQLTTSQELAPVNPTRTDGSARPTPFGNALLVLNDAQTSLEISITIYNIDFTGTQTPDPNDNLTAAHIHGSANLVPPATAPVVWGFIGAPFNDNNPNDVISVPFQVGVGGQVSAKWDAPEGQNTTLTAQLTNILSGSTYVNFHTVQHGGGEVRGAITVVPEPVSSLFLSGGLAALGLCRRIRRRTL